MRPIDADALYERLRDDEDLARQRVIDTPNSFPNGMLNPAAVRYMAQLSERTRIKEIVYDAPTIEPEPQWISCIERLPDKTDDYLCSYNGCAVADICEYDAGRNEWGFFYDGSWRVVSNITAWMPLPEPWKGEES